MAEFVGSVDFQSRNAARDFHDTMRSTGFGLLYNHPIPHALVADVFALWRQFFSSRHKADYRRRPREVLGFFPQSISETPVGCSVKDFKEFFHYAPHGHCPAFAAAKTHALFLALEALAAELLCWLEAYLPARCRHALSEPLNHMIIGGDNLMRIAHYPPFSGTEAKGAMRAAPHVDINLLTVLLSASGPGLQVRDLKGNWHDIPMGENMVCINIGSPLEEATKGYYTATVHRVVNPQGPERNTPRFSIPMFLHARPDARLSARYTAREHRQYHLNILHKEDQAA